LTKASSDAIAPGHWPLKLPSHCALKVQQTPISYNGACAASHVEEVSNRHVHHPSSVHCRPFDRSSPRASLTTLEVVHRQRQGRPLLATVGASAGLLFAYQASTSTTPSHGVVECSIFKTMLKFRVTPSNRKPSTPVARCFVDIHHAGVTTRIGCRTCTGQHRCEASSPLGVRSYGECQHRSDCRKRPLHQGLVFLSSCGRRAPSSLLPRY